MTIKPKKADGVRWKRFKDHVLFDSGHIINEIGFRIWELSDGKHTNEEIAENLSKEYSCTIGRARKDVASFISTLHKEKLIAFK